MNLLKNMRGGFGALAKSGLLTARRLAAAGAPAGWAMRQNRRGSFLILVVGTLALMSVFAIVYIAVGRSDTGLSIGVKRNAMRRLRRTDHRRRRARDNRRS
jgi:hypothetical protein